MDEQPYIQLFIGTTRLNQKMIEKFNKKDECLVLPVDHTNLLEVCKKHLLNKSQLTSLDPDLQRNEEEEKKIEQI